MPRTVGKTIEESLRDLASLLIGEGKPFIEDSLGFRSHRESMYPDRRGRARAFAENDALSAGR